MSESESSIFPPYEAFYIECLLWHTRSACASIDDVNRWLSLVRSEDPRVMELPKSELFGHLQNIVQQAASISRYLWPAPRKANAIHENRAARLRQGLSISEASPLANRDLRNGLEHFDEKLDLYLADGKIGQFIPDYVGYVEPIHEVPTHIFKAFYTNPLIFVLLGQNYEMAPLVNEVTRLNSVLEECEKNGSRLP